MRLDRDIVFVIKSESRSPIIDACGRFYAYYPFETIHDSYTDGSNDLIAVPWRSLRSRSLLYCPSSPSYTLPGRSFLSYSSPYVSSSYFSLTRGSLFCRWLPYRSFSIARGAF